MIKKKPLITVKDLAMIAVLTAILFVQEEILSVLPNIQLTVFLILLYSKKLGFIKTSFIILIHVLLDNLFMNTFNIYIMPFMFIGWMIIPITLTTIFKRIESPIILALLSIGYAFIYSWVFIIPSCLFYNMEFFSYLLSDILFEILLAISSFISVLWLYKPCAKVLDMLLIKK